MKSRNKFFAVCGIMAGAGILLWAVGFGMGGLVSGVSVGSNGLQVHTPKSAAKENENYYKEGEETLEEFQSMDITLDYSEFKVVVSDHFGIEYKVNKEDDFSYQVKDKRLEIVQGYKKGASYFTFINFGFNLWTLSPSYEKEYVTIYIPKGTVVEDFSVINDSGNISFGDFNAKKLTIEAEYGDIKINDMESSDMEFTLDSGNLNIKNVKTETLNVKNEYGYCELEQVSVMDQAKLELDSGDIGMEDTNISNLDAYVEYGNFTGTNVQLEEIYLNMDSGSCTLRELAINKAEIEAEYGKVILGLTDSTSAYGMDLYTDYGEITLDDGEIGERYNRKDGDKSGKQLKINCDSGDIEISGK